MDGAESDWWCLASGRNDVLVLSAGLMLACQFLYWSGIVMGAKTKAVDPKKGD
jgi:hypothetical protein